MKSYLKSLTILLVPAILCWVMTVSLNYLGYWVHDEPMVSTKAEAKLMPVTEIEQAVWFESKVKSYVIPTRHARHEKWPYISALIVLIFLGSVGVQAKWLKSKLST